MYVLFGYFVRCVKYVMTTWTRLLAPASTRTTCALWRSTARRAACPTSYRTMTTSSTPCSSLRSSSTSSRSDSYVYDLACLWYNQGQTPCSSLRSSLTSSRSDFMFMTLLIPDIIKVMFYVHELARLRHHCKATVNTFIVILWLVLTFWSLVSTICDKREMSEKEVFTLLICLKTSAQEIARSV